ncbi:kinase-like domain-containing protein [Mycena galopus ATCC 62051]|nr:kinase-like domain-containing protein [Mycena galopus ATCC 62051]
MSDPNSDSISFVFYYLDDYEQMLGDAPGCCFISKLGFGSSTVWLARDRRESRNVALKITAAKRTSDGKELGILQRLAHSACDSLKAPHVIQLLASFQARSANGVHQVLVTELLFPSLTTPTCSVSFNLGLQKRSFAKRLKVSYLFTVAVSRTGNFGVTVVPEINQFSESQIWEWAAPPRIAPILRASPDRPRTSFPPYLCDTMELGNFLAKFAPSVTARSVSVRILDLGSAYIVDESPAPPCETPLFYAAPEVVFPRVSRGESAPWDQRSDIWSLAIVFHDLVGAQGIFPGLMFNRAELPHFMVSLCGKVPGPWRDYIDSNVFPEGKGWSLDRTAELWKEIELLRRMMKLDPAERPTAAELLNHPYFVGAIS